MATALLGGHAMAQDDPGPVTMMCLLASAANTPDICDCATAEFRAGMSEEDFDLYALVGQHFIENQMNGMGTADAWMAAIDTAETDLARTNPIGKAHREAIASCSG